MIRSEVKNTAAARVSKVLKSLDRSEVCLGLREQATQVLDVSVAQNLSGRHLLLYGQCGRQAVRVEPLEQHARDSEVLLYQADNGSAWYMTSDALTLTQL